MAEKKPKPETWTCRACGRESTTSANCSECGVLLNG